MSDTITVGGLPGTGTTTLCRLLADRFQMPYVYAGALFREEAQRRGMDLASFGKLCEQDASVDRILDARQEKLLHAGGIILEGRLSGWLAHKNRAPALKIWLTCNEGERVRRLVDRDGGDADSQAAAILEREASEAKRYRTYYGADLSDLSIYDLVLDSTSTPPEALAARVEAARA